MFDIGFSELLVVFVVALLILGPERLPHAARTAGLWVRKIRRSINSVQREINAQLDHEELQQKIGETNQRLLKEGQAIQNTITPYPEERKMEVSEPEPLKASAADTENQEKESEVPGDDGITLSASDKSESIEPSLLDDVEKTPEAASRS
ncbi:Sec-independent protein translocase protein TatB [Marinomonas primoryensis]|uniref:Sec-independent protein translocase protein TatB n=1 Tax=Marinomonas primoryensis TaxID=178399 RepID=A0A859D421_9GAMM|nr:Sec-independent protein translocase protein TatB [Marinomonas primoryensis]QKK82010.1 Twin-arginine translocation protein TatB [Marinomonas primoryensis]